MQIKGLPYKNLNKTTTKYTWNRQKPGKSVKKVSNL